MKRGAKKKLASKPGRGKALGRSAFRKRGPRRNWQANLCFSQAGESQDRLDSNLDCRTGPKYRREKGRQEENGEHATASQAQAGSDSNLDCRTGPELLEEKGANKKLASKPGPGKGGTQDRLRKWRARHGKRGSGKLGF